MEKVICDECGKIIEGYTKRHIETLLAQHKIRHSNERLNNGREKSD